MQDVIGKIISNVEKTTKAVVQRSTDVVDITKTRLAIIGEENQIDELIKEMGQLVYDAYKSGTGNPKAIEERCREIDAISEEIARKKNNLARLRNLKRCHECGSENDMGALYCDRCGVKLLEPEVADPAPANEQESAVDTEEV